MNKKGISTLIEVAGIVVFAVILLTVMASVKTQTPSALNQAEISHNLDWQTNNSE